MVRIINTAFLNFVLSMNVRCQIKTLYPPAILKEPIWFYNIGHNCPRQFYNMSWTYFKKEALRKSTQNLGEKTVFTTWILRLEYFTLRISVQNSHMSPLDKRFLATQYFTFKNSNSLVIFRLQDWRFSLFSDYWLKSFPLFQRYIKM